MALPSQTERNTTGTRPVMSRGDRRGSKMGSNGYLIGGAVVLVAAAGFGLWKYAARGAGGSSPSPVAASEPIVTEPVGTSPATSGATPAVAAATPPASTLPPVEVRQGTPAVSGTMPPANTNTVASVGGTPGASDVATLDPTKPLPVDVSQPGLRPGDPLQPTGAGGPASPAAGDVVATGSTQVVRAMIESGDRAMAAGRLVEARTSYARAFMHSEVSKSDLEVLRQKLTTINEDLVFSAKVTPGDPLVESYTVVAGDALDKIRRKRDLTTEWMLIQRVNRMANAHALKVGQKLKLVRGPFHAVVHKADYRLDLFAGSPDEPDNWLYIRSFKVGLGDNNGTPLGTFQIRNKMQNPDWRNPRTGERFGKDDPKNPIGEYWLGWQGLGDSAPITGYGIHGTVDPGSIGQSKSMGCVRLLDEDIKLIYELLSTKISVVRVVP
ncbi:MAG: L,D-transpeptidase family protein [Phycisphaerae bacterium]